MGTRLCKQGSMCTVYHVCRLVLRPSFYFAYLKGSTSSSMSDHWLIRLNGDSKRGSLVSRSSTTCPSSIPDSPESPVFLDNGTKEEKGKHHICHFCSMNVELFFFYLVLIIKACFH